VIALLSSLFILVPEVIVAEFVRHDGEELICIQQVERLSRNQKDCPGVQAGERHSVQRNQPKLHIVLPPMKRKHRPDACQLFRFLRGRLQVSLFREGSDHRRPGGRRWRRSPQAPEEAIEVSVLNELEVPQRRLGGWVCRLVLLRSDGGSIAEGDSRSNAVLT
jgi:hypothetical protein